MRLDLSTLAHAIRVECAATGLPIKLGHAQELLAAAMGLRKFASLQAALKASDDVGHVLFDKDRLEARALELGHTSIGWAEPILKALTKCLPTGHVHATQEGFFDALFKFVDDRTVNDPEVASQTAMTNGNLDEVYMPLYLESHDSSEKEDSSFAPFDQADDHFSFDIKGHVSMDQDPDKPYWGHKVNVEATLTFSRLGGCLFTTPELKVTHAKLLWGGVGEDEDEEDRPIRRRSLTEALAEELGLTEEEAAMLEYDVTSNESDDGLVYSQILEIAPPNDAAILKKIMAKHGTLSVQVWPGFFEDVAMEVSRN